MKANIQKMISVFVLLVSISFFLSTSVLAFGWGHRGHGFKGKHGSPEKRMDKMVEHLTEELNLDDSQVAVLKQIKTEIIAKSKR